MCTLEAPCGGVLREIVHGPDSSAWDPASAGQFRQFACLNLHSLYVYRCPARITDHAVCGRCGGVGWIVPQEASERESLRVGHCRAHRDSPLPCTLCSERTRRTMAERRRLVTTGRAPTVCACGCGRAIPPGSWKWASKACEHKARRAGRALGMIVASLPP